jgi:hypothetical protein
MLNIKKLLVTTLCSLTLFTGSAALNSQKANAGIIIIAATSTAAVVGPVVGLGLASAGFFWGIQSDDLNYKAAALFILDNQIETNKVESIISARYPELDSYLVSEIANSVIEESNLVEFNQDGQKTLKLDENKLSSVLEILSVTNPDLSQKLRSELIEN